MASVHRQVHIAKKNGLLTPEPCVHCGSEERIQAHHADYSKPLEVTWLCQKCHLGEHARLRREGGNPVNPEGGQRGKQFGFLLDEGTKESLDVLAELLPLDQTAIIRLAIRRLKDFELAEKKKREGE